MRISDHIVLHPSGAETASTDTKNVPLDVSMYSEANFYLDVSAASGTSPTLDIDVLTYDQTSGDWFVLTSFTQATTTTTEFKIVSSNLGTKIALDITIAGTTPSFTFTVTGDFKA